MMCLIAWCKRILLPTRDYDSLLSNCIQGALKSCSKRAAPCSGPFVVQKCCTGAGIDLRHSGIPRCCFHSSLQNAMKWTIESRGAAFSSACFLERAVFSFCCWKTGKRGTTHKDSGHLLPVSESVKSMLSDIKAEDLYGGRTHLFSTPPQSFLPLWCFMMMSSIPPSPCTFSGLSLAE